MASDASIRDGLVTRLQTIAGLSAYDHVPDRANTPAAIVRRRLTRYDVVMERGADDFEYVITVLVPWSDPKVAQESLSEYLATSGAKSINAAIDGDQTLGGVVDFARVREAGEEEERLVGEISHMAVDLIVEVTA